MRFSSSRPALALAVAAAMVGLLGGCAAEARSWMGGDGSASPSASASASPSPSASPTPEPDPEDVQRHDCEESPELTVTEEFTVLELDGRCMIVTVNAKNSAITADAIDGLLIQGEGSVVKAEEVGVATIAGQDMILRIEGDIALVTINGDRNVVEVGGTIGNLIVGGNQNEVIAGERITMLVDNGSENEISPR